MDLIKIIKLKTIMQMTGRNDYYLIYLYSDFFQNN